MKNAFLIIAILSCFSLFSQEKTRKPISLEVDYFYGTILEHNPVISHLITGHPTGFFATLNNKTYGLNEWERRYNYPDWGFSMAYQNMHNEHLGEAVGVYGHMNWYFLNRMLRLSVGQGIAYLSNPFNAETNYRNNAYGSRIASSTYLKAGFVKENLWKGLGIQAGFSIIHYSNANLKAPNTSTNTFVINAGVNYQLAYQEFPEYIHQVDSLSRTYAQPIKYNLELRGGSNQSDVIGLGSKPFFVISAYADKRINYKSTFQLGVDVFFSHFLKDLIEYRSIAYPEDELTGEEDYKRVGVFIGHEWRFNKNAFVTQLGYYAYYPYEFETRVYNRLGLKRYVYKDKVFASVSVHSHWAKAEAVEFGLGVRL